MSLNDFLKIIGKNIADLRKSMFLNQSDAATKAGFSYRYYQKIESGTANLTLGSLYAIARCLNVHPTDLLPKKSD